MIRDEQGGFRRGRGCVDQIFAVRQVCEKYLAKRQENVLGVHGFEIRI